MNLRLGDRLAVRMALPDGIAAQPFPPLLLISLVENAVTHGVEPKVGAAGIVIEARQTNRNDKAMLEVEVLDDGVGLREGLTEGTGLANVREQLRVLYGEAAQLWVESRSEGGVRAGLRVPMRGAES
jgi:LytS/YehU family sensor histidine kinase